MWSAEFTGMHRENGCFVLTCHPFVSGRASRIALLEDLVKHVRRARGAWFATCEEIARWHLGEARLRYRRAQEVRSAQISHTGLLPA
jgi:hypothetical protein